MTKRFDFFNFFQLFWSEFCTIHSKNVFVLDLAHLEPELELFEVDDIGDDGDDDLYSPLSPKLKTALARVLDELERKQKHF